MKTKQGFGLAAWLVAVSPFVCGIESANAETAGSPVQLNSGTATLAFSSDVVWALERVEAVGMYDRVPRGFTLADGASYAPPGLTQGALPGNQYGFPLLSITMPVSSLGYSTQDAAATQIGTTGGFTIHAANNGYGGGGVISVSNLHADLATQTVYADVFGLNNCAFTGAQKDCPRGVSAYAINQTNVPFFHFESSQGSSISDASGVTTVKSVFSGLSLVSSVLRQDLPYGYSFTSTDMPSVDMMTGALGFKAASRLLIADIDSTTGQPTLWGSLAIEASFMTPVPEPSSGVLAAIGMAGLALLRRKNQGSK